MSRRRAFVALASSAAVLITVVGVGTVLGAANAEPERADVRTSGITTPAPSDWLIPPGSMALIAAAGFVLLKTRRA